MTSMTLSALRVSFERWNASEKAALSAETNTGDAIRQARLKRVKGSRERSRSDQERGQDIKREQERDTSTQRHQERDQERDQER